MRFLQKLLKIKFADAGLSETDAHKAVAFIEVADGIQRQADRLEVELCTFCQTAKEMMQAMYVFALGRTHPADYANRFHVNRLQVWLDEQSDKVEENQS